MRSLYEIFWPEYEDEEMWEKTAEPKYHDYDKYRPGWSSPSESGDPFDLALAKKIREREE